jgi:hypothetical protein
MKNKITPNIKDLEKAFDGNLDLMLFYLTWVKCGLNASKAYKELHPSVDDHSSRVLGSRWLARVNKQEIMQAYGLDHEKYFDQLLRGVEATKRDQFSGEMYPDHKTRKDYHDKLGKLLGIEADIPTQMQQTNIEVVLTRGE